LAKITKETIAIRISQKDKIYLSVILCLVCVIAIMAVLVPRYIRQHTTIVQTNTVAASDDSEDYSAVDFSAAQNYTTGALLRVRAVKGFASSAKTYLKNNELDTSILNITSDNFEPIEELATDICRRYDILLTAYSTLTAENLAADETLLNEINDFFNMLSAIKK
jgi:hypothetical protein